MSFPGLHISQADLKGLSVSKAASFYDQNTVFTAGICLQIGSIGSWVPVGRSGALGCEHTMRDVPWLLQAASCGAPL